MQKFLLVTMQPTDTAPILLFELADKSEIQNPVAALQERFDTYDQESWVNTSPGLVEHIGFRVVSHAEILMKHKSSRKYALSILDSEKGPLIDMPQITIAPSNSRPIIFSLSMEGLAYNGSEKSHRFFMGVGIRTLKELWNLYQSEKQAA